MSINEEDRFFEALAGRGEPGPDTVRVTVLREAIKQRAEVLREASEVSPVAARTRKMSDEQQALYDELKAKHVFSDSTASTSEVKKPGASKTSSLVSILTRFLADNWVKPLAFAAMLAVVAGIVFQQSDINLPNEERTIVRQGDRVFVLSANPTQFVTDLTPRLEAAGARVTAVAINDREWNIKVLVPPGTNPRAAQELLRDAGFGPVVIEGDIELVIKKP